jgi:hypothetical protein
LISSLEHLSIMSIETQFNSLGSIETQFNSLGSIETQFNSLGIAAQLMRNQHEAVKYVAEHPTQFQNLDEVIVFSDGRVHDHSVLKTGFPRHAYVGQVGVLKEMIGTDDLKLQIQNQLLMEARDELNRITELLTNFKTHHEN